MIIASFTTVPFALFSLLLAYVSHHICLVADATSPLYHFLPISLNSLDLTGFEIAESSDSPDTITTVAGADDTSVGDATEFRWESTKILVVDMFCFMLISSGAQLGRSGI